MYQSLIAASAGETIFLSSHSMIDNIVDSTEEAIKSLCKLPVGWDYGEGIPPTEATIKLAIDIYRMGKEYNLHAEVHPIGEGEIEISFSRRLGDHFVDVLICNDGTYQVDYEIGIGEQYEQVLFCENAPLELIKINLSKIAGVGGCNSSEYCGNILSTKRNKGLLRIASETIKMVFQPFVSPASQKNTALKCVPI
ncbi:MAG: hypothetical protein HQK57_03225 [Deltaproteobacteria bacterium]|nr:hypothetical protein [Deltaproteobacteria bacterium]MBF0507921.1 hypothetical protein [Deltaproteobacteria bacterium]